MGLVAAAFQQRKEEHAPLLSSWLSSVVFSKKGDFVNNKTGQHRHQIFR